MLGAKIPVSLPNPTVRGSRPENFIPFGNELPHRVDHESELDGSEWRAREWRQLVEVVGHDPGRCGGSLWRAAT